MSADSKAIELITRVGVALAEPLLDALLRGDAELAAHNARIVAGEVAFREALIARRKRK